jgi:PKD repeat protein
MLRRLLPDWRLIALTSALAVSLGSPWGAAARADSPQVTVVSPGGAAQTLSLAALAGGEDVVERSYVVRSGGAEEQRVLSGYSLAAVLDAAGADPFSFSYLEVQRPGGGAVTLSKTQALGDGAFPDGPPLVYPTAAGTGFLRPSAGAGDENGGDAFEAPQGLTIALRKGASLQLRATATPRKVAVGEKVKFAAVVERSGAGEALTYSWYFDDGNSADGPEATHSFAKPGSYDVVVGVKASAEEAGASAVVSVQVGAAAEGPDRKGGGKNKDAKAPDHGAATGRAEGPGAGGPPTGAPSAGAPASAGTPSVPADPSGCSLCRDTGEKEQPAPREARRPEPSERSPKRNVNKERSVPPGELVSGELVAQQGDAAPEVVAPPQAPVAARTGNPDSGPGGGGVPAAAWGVLATLGLLGAGALVEARGLGALLPWRRPA